MFPVHAPIPWLWEEAWQVEETNEEETKCDAQHTTQRVADLGRRETSQYRMHGVSASKVVFVVFFSCLSVECE